MATYFGEVLPFVSRAIDDEDEDEDETVSENDENLIVSNPDQTSKCNSLVVAIGPIACGFSRAYLFNDDTQLINTINRSNETKKNEIICEIFKINEQLNIYLIPRQINSEITYELTEKIFNGLKNDVKIVILSANHETQFYTSSNEKIPFLRCLKSSEYSEKVICPILEPPNVVIGLPAAILTSSEVRKISSILFVLYSDVTDIDSLNTETFLPVLNQQLFNDVKINSDAKKQLKQISSTNRITNNLYI